MNSPIRIGLIELYHKTPTIVCEIEFAYINQMIQEVIRFCTLFIVVHLLASPTYFSMKFAQRNYPIARVDLCLCAEFEIAN